MHVLRANLDIWRFAQGFHHPGNGGERRHDHYFDISDVSQIEQQRLDKSCRLGLRHVHLPIGSYDLLAHKPF
jgi:hypothetical protein